MRAFVLAACLAAPAAAAAETVVLLPATGANVSEATLAAATDVLRVHLEQTGRFLVLLGGEPGREATPAEAAAVARASGAQLALALRVARLAQNASVRLAAYRTDGAVVHLDQLGAGEPDDLDPVLKRLAVGLATGSPARQLAEIDTVTAREVQPLHRVPAEMMFGLRLGAVSPASRVGSRPAHALTGGGVFWLYDARTFIADVSLTFHSSDVDPNTTPDVVTSLGIGAYYPLTRTDLSPYLGGGLDYTWSRYGGEGASGLTGRAAAGLILGRTSRVVVRGEAGWFVNLYAERAQAGGAAMAVNGPYAWVGLAMPY